MNRWLLHWLRDYWLYPAVLLSALVGVRAAMIHYVPSSDRWWMIWNAFQEFLQNFVGSFAGWCCVGALAVRISAAPELRSLNSVDIFLFLAAILGVSGRLAETVHQFIVAIGKIVEGVAKKLG
jgi:hypothetical protein